MSQKLELCVTQILVIRARLERGNLWRDASDFGRPTGKPSPLDGTPRSPQRTRVPQGRLNLAGRSPG